MLFHSQIFLLLFLPGVLSFYYLFKSDRVSQQWILILFSLVFYGYWEISLVPLLILSVVFNWFFTSFFINKSESFILPFLILVNIIVLVIFKYADFVGESLAFVGGFQHKRWDILLPLGISFFTFQQISYLMDFKRGQVEGYGFREYALYVTFFPQLIAGPVVRHSELIPQFKKIHIPGELPKKVGQGLMFFVIGMVKKIHFGDQLAKIVDVLYQTHDLTFLEAWLAAVGFSMQIYFDFSGYSDMAIGLALLFGFTLPFNFNAPYRATSVIEFWRRWHMTLSHFLKDYLYISLGGNKFGLRRQALALFVTMLLGGLWHGASWTFVVWGGWHGLALSINHAWQKYNFKLPVTFAWLLTFITVVMGFVWFRASDFSSALSMFQHMLTIDSNSFTVRPLKNVKVILLAFAIVLLCPTSQTLVLKFVKPNKWLAVSLGGLATWLIVKMGEDLSNDFIYFQF